MAYIKTNSTCALVTGPVSSVGSGLDANRTSTNGTCNYTTVWWKMCWFSGAPFTGSVSSVDGKLDANRTSMSGACNHTIEWRKSRYTSAPFTSPTLSGGFRFRRSICHSICHHTTQELIDFIYKGSTPYIHRIQPPKQKSSVLCIYRSGCGNKGNNGNGSEAEIENGPKTGSGIEQKIGKGE